MATENIRVGSLDFNDVKTSIKNYLQSQTEFTDYNFEGSNISTLLNVLAYNTHYAALSANFIANEMFLDTAVKRANVVSRAKELGYTPRSRRCSKTTLSITFSNVLNTSTLPAITLPRGTRFNASVGDESFTFVTTAATSISRTFENSAYVYRGTVSAYEGILISETKLYDGVDPTIIISNRDIDTSTLKVEVLEDNVNWIEYSSPSVVLTVNETSKVYFIQEGIDGFEIYFGDGNMGFKPPNNVYVRFTYMVTSGGNGNGASRFTLGSLLPDLEGDNQYNVSVTGTVAAGGLTEETIDSIKLNAINQYGTQNRAVISSDYAALTLQNFAEVKDCLAWDGADNVPPKFGKVVLCAQPLVGDVLTVVQKNVISSFLQSKGIANIRIDFVDPEYIELVISSVVRYDINALNVGSYDLMFTVKTAISDYANATINQFGSKFRYSSLIREIDSADHSIISNLTEIKLLKTFSPSLFSKNSIQFGFANEIKAGSFISNAFYVGDSNNRMQLKDDGTGKINVTYSSSGQDMIYQSGIGAIDYTTGVVQIDNLIPTKLEDISLKLNATPLHQDLLSSKNVILNVALENITVSVLPDYS